MLIFAKMTIIDRCCHHYLTYHNALKSNEKKKKPEIIKKLNNKTSTFHQQHFTNKTLFYRWLLLYCHSHCWNFFVTSTTNAASIINNVRELFQLQPIKIQLFSTLSWTLCNHANHHMNYKITIFTRKGFEILVAHVLCLEVT